MATPKKKVSHLKKRHRFMSILRNQLRKMGGYFNLVKCDNCGALKRNHRICPSCNTYKKRVYGSRLSKKDGKKIIKA